MTTMRQDEPRGFGNKRKLGRLRCASLLGLALLVAACADRGPADSSCMQWLTKDAKTQDIALSGDGTRAAVFEDPKSLFSRPAELVIYDARNGRRLTSGHYGYSLKWIGDEIFMTAPAGAVRAWNPNLGLTRTVLICDPNDQDPTGSCRFDIGPGGSVVWRTMGEPPGLAFSPSPGAQAAWTSPVSVIGTPGLSPDGRLVAAQIVGGYFVVLETERGTVVSTASGPFGWGIGSYGTILMSACEYWPSLTLDVAQPRG